MKPRVPPLEPPRFNKGGRNLGPVMPARDPTPPGPRGLPWWAEIPGCRGPIAGHWPLLAPCARPQRD